MTKEQGSRKKYQGKVIIGSSADIAPTYKLTIRYFKEGKFEFQDPYIGYFKEGESFNITSPSLAGYNVNYNSVTSPETGMPAKDVEVKVNYTLIKYYTLTVHYVDSNGNTLADDYISKLEEGQTFTVVSPTINGYTPSYAQVTSPATGMPARNVTITVIYQKGTGI